MSEQKPNSSRKENSDDTVPSGSTAVGSDPGKITTTNQDKTNLLPHLCPPSDEEADCFYFGLPSFPRLIGRASAGIERWESREEQFARKPTVCGFQIADEKALGAIGAHKIRTCWNNVRPNVLTAISHLPWSSVDVCRIGRVDVTLLERPVVVWIGVDLGDSDKPDHLPWEDVAEALRSCRRILNNAGLDDVDCQLRVSRVVSLASPRLLEPLPKVHSQWHYLAQRFTTSIGMSLSPFERPTLEGTLGVFLSTKSVTVGDRPLWAVTCRHVGIPNADHPDNAYYRLQDDGKKKPVGLNVRAKAEKWIACLSEHKAREARSTVAAEVAGLYEAVKDFGSDDARQIGHVFLSPPIGMGQTSMRWTRDWCLLDLDQSKFPGGKSPVNVVDLRTEMERSTLNELFHPHLRNRHRFKFPDNGLLRISGVIPLAEIRNPTTLDKNGEECCLVGKRGAATGLTWGCPLELESVVCQRMPDGSKFESYEWAIHGSLQKKTVSFSAPGDSGAAVFDTQGRLGGFVTRGTDLDSGRSVDITYATPAELVLADIEEKLGQGVVLL